MANYVLKVAKKVTAERGGRVYARQVPVGALHGLSYQESRTVREALDTVGFGTRLLVQTRLDGVVSVYLEPIPDMLRDNAERLAKLAGEIEQDTRDGLKR